MSVAQGHLTLHYSWQPTGRPPGTKREFATKSYVSRWTLDQWFSKLTDIDRQRGEETKGGDKGKKYHQRGDIAQTLIDD